MEKLRRLVYQLFKFGIVGVVAAVIDFGTLVILREFFGVDELIAAPIAFSVSVVFNYLMSMKYVFVSKGGSRTREFVVFVVLSVGGLGINQFIMWYGTDVLGIHYLIVKISAMFVVPIYNFVSRKIFLEKKEVTEGEKDEHGV